MLKLFQTEAGPIVEKNGVFYLLARRPWDHLINRDDLLDHLNLAIADSTTLDDFSPQTSQLLAPIGTQEVWAAGVTYYRSRTARMEESETAGGGSFYDRVYSAARPELFFKASASRIAAPGNAVRIRADSKWNVPEPELTLLITSGGKIIGYTIGNDMSSRDIEGENPLYLPQAKVYDGCCALGPAILVTDQPLPKSTAIQIRILRGDAVGFKGSTTLAELKRTPEELVEYLYRDNTFPAGAFLMTGTGIIPPNEFTLEVGDQVEMTIEPIGTLRNVVEQRRA